MTAKPNETDRDGSTNDRLSLLDTLNNKNQIASRVLIKKTKKFSYFLFNIFIFRN
jgi:hypothetical protein